MRTQLLKSAAVLAMLAPLAPASAEDIDLFVQPAAASNKPNILFVIDNTANWNQNFTKEMAALQTTFNSFATNLNEDGSAKFRVGIMFATETGSPNNNVSGNYVRAAIRDMDATNSGLYATMISRFDQLLDVGNAGKSGIGMIDAYQYFLGGNAYAGNNKVKTDYTGNDTSNKLEWRQKYTPATAVNAFQAVYNLPGNALSSKAATRYNSPTTSGTCGRNYIIYISNGPNQESASDDKTANQYLAAAGGSTTQIPISPSGSASNPSDEWTRFMYKSSLGIVTYTLDVQNQNNTGQQPGWTALLKSMAEVSNGKYFNVSADPNATNNLGLALAQIFSEIQAVNSVFASVSLPVSVNTEGTYLNQVYIGMFRPDQDGKPMWAGNLKQYKLGIVSGSLKLLDANDNQAINPLTGFITSCARSFWTPGTVDTYWVFHPQGDCLAVPNSQQSNYPDGQIVEKGGAAYVLRSSTTRTLTTCSTTFANCTSLVDWNAINVSPTDLNATLAQQIPYLNFAKGLDVLDENINGVTDLTTPSEMRPSAHGDVVHSRPIAINYGTDTSPLVVVYYGANDGVLRAINGNRTDNINSTPPGKELWGFIPPQFDKQYQYLYANNPQIAFYGNTNSPLIPKPYGVDGPISAYKSSSVAWLYAGMRRGGRVLYSFDVSNITNSSGSTAPSLKWKLGCPNNFTAPGTVDDTGCTSNMSTLGQTWSAPKVFTADGYSTTSGGVTTYKPMLIMGGGYDTCEDIDASSQPSCIGNEKGNRVFVLDADTGTILKTFTTDRAVVADVFVVPDKTTGRARWAYAVDLGGNIYRISGDSPNTAFGSTDPNNWNITKIASLGCATPSTSCWPTRKFMLAPDVVEVNGLFYLLLGSGDREKPLMGYTNAYNVTNYFFMVNDLPTSSTWLSDENSNCNAQVLCLASLLNISGSSNPLASDLASKKGWYLSLSPHEQVVTSAITVYGTTTFSTHTPAVPEAGTCLSNLGTAKVYNVAFRNAAPAAGQADRSQIVTGGGIPPSPVAGMVKLDSGQIVPFLIGGSTASPLEGGQPTPPPTASFPKSMTYWYIKK